MERKEALRNRLMADMVDGGRFWSLPLLGIYNRWINFEPLLCVVSSGVRVLSFTDIMGAVGSPVTLGDFGPDTSPGQCSILFILI